MKQKVKKTSSYIYNGKGRFVVVKSGDVCRIAPPQDSRGRNTRGTDRVEDAVGNAVCVTKGRRCYVEWKRLRRFKSIDSSVKVRDLVAKRRAERVVIRQIVAVVLDAADVNAAVAILRACKVRHRRV